MVLTARVGESGGEVESQQGQVGVVGVVGVAGHYSRE